MEYVDEIVHKTEILINNYYGDNDTLYIFTADHGMTNWGKHQIRFFKTFYLTQSIAKLIDIWIFVYAP